MVVYLLFVGSGNPTLDSMLAKQVLGHRYILSQQMVFQSRDVGLGMYIVIGVSLFPGTVSGQSSFQFPPFLTCSFSDRNLAPAILTM